MQLNPAPVKPAPAPKQPKYPPIQEQCKALTLLSLDELEEKKIELECAIALLKFQIGEAKSKKHAQGIISDPDWFHKTNLALHLKQILFNALLSILKKRRKEEEASSFHRTFIEVAREFLPEEVFHSLMDEANKKGKVKERV